MTNVLGQINKLRHLAKHNKHYSLMNSHFSAECDPFCNTLPRGVHYVKEASEPRSGSGKKEIFDQESFFNQRTRRRTRLNYIFVGCDSHDKTLVTKIALNRETAERKTFAASRAGRRKMIEYLKA